MFTLTHKQFMALLGVLYLAYQAPDDEFSKPHLPDMTYEQACRIMFEWVLKMTIENGK